ncbi:MAG: cyclic-phosphate processing receiver domain-containing protein [bacterium]
MSYFLFLDDYRKPEDAFSYTNNAMYINKKWLVVRSYDEFVKCIEQNGVPHTVSFDHDLAYSHYTQEEIIPYDTYKEKTGYHCAKWLIDYCMNNNKKLPTAVLIHSMNPVGSQNIRSVFDNHNKNYEL